VAGFKRRGYYLLYAALRLGNGFQQIGTNVSRTRLLVVLLVFVVLVQVFPEKTGAIEIVAVVGAALYCVAWGTSRYRAQYKKKRMQEAQDAADDQEYRQYKTELDSIRAKYDPNRDLTDPDSISQQYKDELSALHDKHEDMLTRKFGA
jgi:hypothetical protein